jgi:YD repeat-containing protein
VRTRWTTSAVHRFVSIARSDRVRGLWSRSEAVLAGDVDVASGRVLVGEDDLALPSGFGLARSYVSGVASRNGPLGFGWSHGYDSFVFEEPDRVVFREPGGREIEFDAFGRQDRAAKLDSVTGHALTVRSDGSYSVVAPDRSVYELSKRHGDRTLLVRIERGELSIEIDYDGPRVVGARASTGHRLAFHYDGESRISGADLEGVGGQKAKVARYAYDDVGDLALLADDRGEVRYEYVAHLLVRRTDRSGRSRYFGYDGIGDDSRCVRTWSDGGSGDRTLDYKSPVTRVTDSRGRATVYRFDPIGRPVGREREKLEFDGPTFALVSHESPRFGKTAFERDGGGRLAAIVRPDGTRIEIGLDPEGRVTRVRDPDRSDWSWRFDPAGRKVVEIDPSGVHRELRYDGPAASISIGALREAEWKRERSGGVSSMKVEQGEERSAKLDWLGRPVEAPGPDGRVVSVRYDADGSIARLAEADGKEHRFKRDEEGRLVEAILAGGHVKFGYDRAGRITRRATSVNRTDLGWDAEGALLSVDDEARGNWTFARDRLGRVVEEKDFSSRTYSYKYSGASFDPVAVFLPGGGKVRFAYDDHGRLRSVDHPDGRQESFAYDRSGHLIEARSEDVVALIERDGRGRVVAETLDGKRVDYGRDRAGRLRSVQSSLGGSCTFVRDPSGKLLEVLFGRPERRMVVERDQAGRLVGRELGALRVSWRRAPEGRIEERRVRVGTRYRDRVVYDYTQEGRVRTLFEEGGGTIAPEPRRLRRSREKRDGSGRIVEFTSQEGERYEFAWSSAGLLSSAKLPDESSIGVLHDAFGRVVAFEGSASRRWLYLGARPFQELSSSDPPITWFYEPDDPLPFARLQGERALLVAHTEGERAVSAYDEAGEPFLRAVLGVNGEWRPFVEHAPWPFRGGALAISGTDLHLDRAGWRWPASAWLTPEPDGIGSLTRTFGERRPPTDPYVPWAARLARRAHPQSTARFVASLASLDAPFPAPLAPDVGFTEAEDVVPELRWLGLGRAFAAPT